MTALAWMGAWVPVLVWAGIIFWLSSIPGLHSGLEVWDFILRKGAHVTEFAILTALLIRAFRRSWEQMAVRRLMLWCASLAVLYAVSDEIHQAYVPGRGPSAFDVLIDCCGIVLVLLIYRRIVLHEATF